MIEKRLFLAIGLSLTVVWLWSTITPNPKLSQKLSNNTQQTENNEVEYNKTSSILPEIIPNDVTKVIEETDTLTSEKLNIEFSNIGGSIKKVTIVEYNATLPISGITSIAGYEDADFILENASDKKIVYSHESSEIKILKTYSIRSGDYIIDSGIELQNNTNMSKIINVDIKSYTLDSSSLDNKYDVSNDKSLNEYLINISGEIYRKAGAFKFSLNEKKEEFGSIFWTGFRNRYYSALIKPNYETTGYTVDPVGANRLNLSIKAKEVVIPANSKVNFESIIFIGPEEMSLLKKYNIGFEKAKRYYRFGLFDGIAKIIDGLMHGIYKVIPSWGACIILISIIIYFSMYPLTMRGMASMKKMQSLQPFIINLKEKYKDNPQKMNKEMMELYKEHKVNPLGGCLPMLLQMPVFIGLYQVLWRSASFKGASFLWIKDLSQPDRFFILPNKMPIIGNEINLLPIIMAVVMFLQQKLSSKNIVITDPGQAAQQKMMTTIMPIFLGFIFYKFASGLCLYFTMFYVFSTFTQWKMSKVSKISKVS